MAWETAQQITDLEVEVEVNTGDDEEGGKVYLTVTGTSAEAGDDGQVGRSNRANGLITPYRPMMLEAGAGKNPVTHVGKLYKLTANKIASAIVEAIPEVMSSHIRLYVDSLILPTGALRLNARHLNADDSPRTRAKSLRGRIRVRNWMFQSGALERSARNRDGAGTGCSKMVGNWTEDL